LGDACLRIAASRRQGAGFCHGRVHGRQASSNSPFADALKKGPVVLLVLSGRIHARLHIEAHNFADAMDDFQKLGATVIGVSHDSIETLDRFSLTECRSKFPVAADTDATIMKNYDAVQNARPNTPSASPM